MHRSRIFLVACAGVLILLDGAAAGAASSRPDLSKELTLYTIGYSHLDTQWRWTYPQVIREFIPNTIQENGALFAKYPHYIFNWSGANRYRLMQEYHPGGFAQVSNWVAQGRWFPCGNSWEECDVLAPSAESVIRQIMYGNHYFKREFGVESSEFTLPDCFGFPASLPSILHHCGIRGFSTQKLTWGSAVGIPFNVGRWEGLDGESVVAVLNGGDYNGNITTNLATDSAWKDRLEQDGQKLGVFGAFHFYGVGDRGGSPRPDSVKWVEESINTTGAVRVLSARADQFFNDITPKLEAKLPSYRGDLLLTEHSAGSITSQAYMKHWNRQNELLADAAERASVAAHLLGAARYPADKLRRAWQLFLAGQMHDILPGTCIPKAYEYAWNDQILALNLFAEVLQNAVGGVARGLDTRVEGIPMLIYNPLSIVREDVVEAELEFAAEPVAVVVRDGKGNQVATQILSRDGRKVRFAFLARVPSVGFAVYGAAIAPAATEAAKLKITERVLENDRYHVTLDERGDLSSIRDKKLAKELLAAPARLAFQQEIPRIWPAWNMDWKDRTNPPVGYVDGPATFRIVENGPARVALEVTRVARDSRFVQTIRLAAGAAADRIEVVNRIDWQSKGCSLKAEFPLTVSNPRATYNWELGKIERSGNDQKKYEVPSHQWFDLTDVSGQAGVSILTGAKYGSDKPADNVMRLTLLYTPGLRASATSYREQQTQDWGRHDFIYGITSHAGAGCQGSTDWQAMRMEQPLLAFQTAKHAGKLGNEFSLLKVDSEQIAVRTIKLAETGHEVVVRLQELAGRSPKEVALDSVAQISAAQAVSGIEKPLGKLPSKPNRLGLAFKPYELRSLALELKPLAKLGVSASVPVRLPFNADVFSFDQNRRDGSFDDNGRTMPAEMIGDKVVSEGIEFAIGSRKDGALNAVMCLGQVIRLPQGKFNRLYFLASAGPGENEAEFQVDDVPQRLQIQDWSGPIGAWDNRIFEGPVAELTYSVNNTLLQIDPGFIKRAPVAWFCSHRHEARDRTGRDDEYNYCYLFKYALPIPAGAKTLTLPSNPRIGIVAVTVAHDENSATVATLPLYDDFTGRTAIPLKAGLN